jgi:hypothetical protein
MTLGEHDLTANGGRTNLEPLEKIQPSSSAEHCTAMSVADSPACLTTSRLFGADAMALVAQLRLVIGQVLINEVPRKMARKLLAVSGQQDEKAR